MEPKEVLRRMIENREWLDSNVAEIQRRYGGKWIGVAEKRVVADGDNPQRVADELAQRGMREEAIILLMPAGQIVTPI